MAVSGVYVIRHVQNGFTYVGSSKDISKRLTSHRRLLNRGQHYNKAIQQDWSADGEGAFTTAIVERVSRIHALLDDAEQQWCDRLKARGTKLYCVIEASRTHQQINVPLLVRSRRRAALSQRDLAQLSGVAASTIARIELGQDANPSTIRRLAAALKCEPHELMGAEDAGD